MTDAVARSPAATSLGAVLTISNVSKTYAVAGRLVHALSRIDLAIEAGEFVSIVGASGCGKSTLLRLILGLDIDYDGEIRVDGRKIDRPGVDRSIVFQEHRLLPWLSVEANIAAALRQLRLGAGEKRDLVEEHLRLVGLDQFAKAYPAQLSGGMAQRVAIARALVTRPRFLLLDEPFGALDALTRLRLQDELLRIVAHGDATALLVTHDVDEAVYLGNRVVIMHPHPGRIARVLPVIDAISRDRSDPNFIRLRDEVLSWLGVSKGGASELGREASRPPVACRESPDRKPSLAKQSDVRIALELSSCASAPSNAYRAPMIVLQYWPTPNGK